ncbi:ABC transporter ATP-binding protein [Gluconacetobacter azotocaptans]|uniref:ABC transporter ATP-binding protein n=1 Tax=Gluconacetobacter azotocaptans TaxID=142834 RepID=A0A7W4PDU9_9PROT|nr:ABC transporter ATP-binding protein [Gluconacetobacter azotocaptans]MBB2190108.1 ABC transporter ATP-binding protein [Gluconacetobacter azotocaptans]GBQ26185.1 ABC transporter ATP-binding protein [Gluconacetobacter azotocaptans DSM 13594]
MSTPGSPVLSIAHLTVTLPAGADRPAALHDVSLTVNRREIVCLVGQSGSGKSVLSAAIMGALPSPLRIAGGRILFDGRDVTALDERQWRTLRGAAIAMVFQEPMSSLNPAIPVGRQIEEVLILHRPSMPAPARARRVVDLLQDVHLPEPEAIGTRLPHQLSGGQCQRVVIAMALALDPVLLIADEPTTALDVTTQAQILSLLRELRDRRGHAVLLITHDLGVVADIADRVAIMRAGRIVECGDARTVLTAPATPYVRELVAAFPHGMPGRPASGVPSGGPPVLAVRGLGKRHGAFTALADVMFDLHPGEMLAVIGESGSGKSTLARILCRLLPPDCGKVVVAGADFSTPLRRRGRPDGNPVQMVFQDPAGALNPRRSVRAILERAARIGGMTRQQAARQAVSLLAMVGLPADALDRTPHAFSGGQRQRICIARALALRPRVLIADESVAALDPPMQRQILDLFLRLKAETGLAILFITHDLRLAAHTADRIAVMRRGRIVEVGAAADVFATPSDPYTRILLSALPGQHWHGLAG